MNTPAEILNIWIENGKKKTALSILKMLLLGMMAGIFIGFGAYIFIVATGGGYPDEALFGKFLGAALFPCGLMLVILCGAELFTGNNLLTLALFDRQVTFLKVLRNWITVYIGNLIGSVLIAYLFSLTVNDDVIRNRAVTVAIGKVSGEFIPLMVKGILCNILVVLACWFQAGSRDLTGKVLAIWFPIAAFVFAGFEHSVANMTYIPLGMFLGADVSVGDMFLKNLLPVTLGNMIGGALFVPVIYYICYGRKKK
ncbi:MAG: formate/nitrite transporter family protein [Clostridia bacterium]|nr:formate/nitrite transporter family protein [Clostridia bacterium]